MGRPRTDPALAMSALALVESGYEVQEAARMTGLHPRTLKDIKDEDGPWKGLIDDPTFREYRETAKAQIRAGALELVRKGLRQVEAKLPEANAYQACLISSILIDKERLIAGESTANIAVQTKTEIANIDELANRLSESLLKNETESR